MKKVKEGYSRETRSDRSETSRARKASMESDFKTGSADEGSMRTNAVPTKRVPQMLASRNPKGIRNRA